METDHTWRNEYRLVEERLCAICFSSEGSETRVRLGLVTFEPDTEEGPGDFSVDTFERFVDRSQLVKEIIVREYPDGHIEARRSVMRKVHKEGEREQFVRVGNLALGPNRKSLQLRDVCAVCLMAVRRF